MDKLQFLVLIVRNRRREIGAIYTQLIQQGQREFVYAEYTLKANSHRHTRRVWWRCEQVITDPPGDNTGSEAESDICDCFIL